MHMAVPPRTRPVRSTILAEGGHILQQDGSPRACFLHPVSYPHCCRQCSALSFMTPSTRTNNPAAEKPRGKRRSPSYERRLARRAAERAEAALNLADQIETASWARRHLSNAAYWHEVLVGPDLDYFSHGGLYAEKREMRRDWYRDGVAAEATRIAVALAPPTTRDGGCCDERTR